MLKYLYHIIIALILVAFLLSVYFLYNNFYLTLANSREVASLVGKVSIASLNMKRIESVLQNLDKKEMIKANESIADPFFPSGGSSGKK